MGKTYKIHPKRRKNIKLSRRNRCIVCGGKISRFHHNHCDGCWNKIQMPKYKK